MMRRTIVLLATMALTLLVASGVAWAVNKIGTDGPDNLMGTNGADNLFGKGGNDDLFGLKGRDKNLVGGHGNDAILAGQGADNVLAGGGNDEIIDGDILESSHDNISGGAGNDYFQVWHKPAFEDIIVCGRGYDRVLADPKDVVAPDCEWVRILQVQGSSEEELLQQEQEVVNSPPIVALEAGLAPPPLGP